MNRYSLTHVANHPLLSKLDWLITQDHGTTADLLAHIGEVDDRKLYLPAAYPSMYLYCVHKLHMSEDTAYKRIRVARAARQFPVIFEAVADGRLGLSAVLLLTPKLTADTVSDLLVAATHKTNADIERLLAERFPQPDLPTLVMAVGPAVVTGELAVRPVGTPDGQLATWLVGTPALELAVRPVAPAGEARPPRAKATPLAPGRFAWQLTVNQHTQDQMDYARALMGHAVPSGDMAAIVEQAMDALVEKLERRKLAKCARSRPRRGAPKGRHVPAEVRRTVWNRDQGRCTFAGNNGKRCEATSRLEFDHIEPVAKGGQATASNLRLRCHAHNQYEAECAFGGGFMQTKREEARRRAAEAKARANAAAEAKARERAEAAAKAARQEEIVPWLRRLGFSVLDARRGAALGAEIPDAPLEQRVRVALQGLAPNCVRGAASAASNWA